VVTTVVL